MKQEERPTYGLRKSFEAVRAEVSIERYLLDQGVEVRRSRARCLVHGGDNDQAFAIYPGQQRWHCFRCDEGGDVVDLCRAVEGGESWEAMMVLAQRYDVYLPERCDAWREWQNEKGQRRRKLRDVLAESYRRRYFRAFFTEYIRSIEPEVRGEEAERIWGDLYQIGVLSAEKRLSV